MAGEDYPSEPSGSIPSDHGDHGGAAQEVPREWRQQAGATTAAAAVGGWVFQGVGVGCELMVVLLYL